MDLERIIDELYEERERLTHAIELLEAIAAARSPRGEEGAKPRKRRGRRSMSQAERLKVSQRMRAYWEKRRQQ